MWSRATCHVAVTLGVITCHPALHLLFCTSAHVLCLFIGFVCLSDVTLCSSSRCKSMFGASLSLPSTQPADPHSECCDCVAVYYTVPEGDPWCCVGVVTRLGDGCVSRPRPQVHWTWCLGWAAVYPCLCGLLCMCGVCVATGVGCIMCQAMRRRGMWCLSV